MAIVRSEIAQLYRKRARSYDVSANLYYLLGIREFAYRKMAVRALHLQQGDTVVELGCGTGLNFGYLRKAVGPHGKIVGVDLTPEMLAKAAWRAERNGWNNVELVHSDILAYQFPRRLDGILSTFAITLVPEYDEVIKRGAEALPAGKRLVVLDFKFPPNWPMWLVKFFVMVTRPFGVSLDLRDRHPWESIDRYMTTAEFKELYFGGAYVCAGEA